MNYKKVSFIIILTIFMLVLSSSILAQNISLPDGSLTNTKYCTWFGGYWEGEWTTSTIDAQNDTVVISGVISGFSLHDAFLEIGLLTDRQYNFIMDNHPTEPEDWFNQGAFMLFYTWTSGGNWSWAQVQDYQSEGSMVPLTWATTYNFKVVFKPNLGGSGGTADLYINGILVESNHIYGTPQTPGWWSGYDTTGEEDFSAAHLMIQLWASSSGKTLSYSNLTAQSMPGYDPTFEIDVANQLPDRATDVHVRTGVVAGETDDAKLAVHIPSGFQFGEPAAVPANTVVGSGYAEEDTSHTFTLKTSGTQNYWVMYSSIHGAVATVNVYPNDSLVYNYGDDGNLIQEYTWHLLLTLNGYLPPYGDVIRTPSTVGDYIFTSTYYSEIGQFQTRYDTVTISQPAEVWVDDDYDSTTTGWEYDHFDKIQDGVDAVASSGTVNVAVGTYIENVTITKSLNLLGASSTTTLIDGNNIGNTVTITASNVTLSGFAITGGWANGLDVFHPVGGVVVDGNSRDTSLTGITIEDNIIDGNPGNGVYVSAAGHGGGANNVVIRDCQISNNGGSNAGISLTYPNYIIRPVGVWDEWKRPKNILVQGNTIYSNYEYGVYVSAGENNVIRSNEIYNNSKYGLQLASSWNRTDIPCEYTAIEDNNIHDNVRNGVKLTSYNQHNTFTVNTIYNNGFGGTKDYYQYGFLFQDGNDNTIENNTITGNAIGGLYLWGKGDPSYTWYSTTNNIITGNTISSHSAVGGKGIYIPANYGNPNSGFLNHHIYANILMCNIMNGEDNGAVINWDDGVTTGNFWDDWTSNAGYPTQYNISGTAGSVDNYPQAPSVVWVDDDWVGTACGDSVSGHLFGYDAFDKIQDGVDAVAVNGTVNVLAGTYEEQVVIDKGNLTIAGAGAGDNPSINTIVKSPTTINWFFTTSANNYPIMGIDGVTGVAIQDLRVDGSGRGNSNYKFVGIGFWNGDGSVIDCEIIGIRNTPFSGAQHGVGIYSFNNSGGPYTINVNGTHIEDFQKNGMALSGNNLTANVENCTVIGYGLTDITAQNGIQISSGAGGTVTDCSISDIGYTPATWIASGMLFLNGTSVVVNGTNSITGSQASIVFQETQGSVDGVTISSADIAAAEGISIRDYGYYKNRMAEESIKSVPVSPLEEEWQFQAKSPGTSTAVAIDNSTITGIYHSGSYGVAAWSLGDNVNATINNSEIQNWEIGIVSYESGSSANLIANSNNISNNDMGFWTNASSVQNAEANWWGDVLGPYHPTTNPNASGNEVADNVDYSPWWGANYVNDPHSLAWTWFLNTSNNSTIQEGIDLVTSGDLVRPRPGTYNENIVINKSLTLLGAGQDSVLIYPDSSDIGLPDPEPGPSFRGSQMCVVQASNVTIDGFTFDGDSPTLTPPGTLDVRNGIITNYYTGDWSNLKVQNCTVKNIYLRGIYASAQTPNNLTGVDFNHNTVSNVKGVSMQSAGIMLWGASGNVKHSNVSDASLGIFYHWYSDGNIDSNTVTTSEVCLGANSNDLETSISYNTVTSSPQGIQTVSTLAPINVTFNSVTDCTSGVVLYGGGTAQANIWDNDIEGLGYYSTYGIWGSTDLSPWGLGDLYANLKRNSVKYNFYGVVLNEPSGDRSKTLSVLIGGASTDHNFIYNNSNYELLLEYCNDDQTATYNYWGKSLYTQIEDEIYHKVDQPDLGLVTFDPAILHGDVNLDGQISVADVVYLINFLFKGGPAPELFVVAEVNRDGSISISDVIYLINYLFKGGPAPKVLISETLKPAVEKPTVEKPKLTKPVYLRSVEK